MPGTLSHGPGGRDRPLEGNPRRRSGWPGSIEPAGTTPPGSDRPGSGAWRRTRSHTCARAGRADRRGRRPAGV